MLLQNIKTEAVAYLQKIILGASTNSVFTADVYREWLHMGQVFIVGAYVL